MYSLWQRRRVATASVLEVVVAFARILTVIYKMCVRLDIDATLDASLDGAFVIATTAL